MNKETANLLNRALQLSIWINAPDEKIQNSIYQWRADVREQFELAGYEENADGVFENAKSHIPHGAIEKTDYIFAENPAFKEFAPESRFFTFDEKAYSINPNSLNHPLC